MSRKPFNTPAENASQPSRRGSRGGMGFSLIELMVVMAIIIILVAMVSTSAFSARQAGFRARAHTEIRELTNAMKSYAMTYGDWPPEVLALSPSPTTPLKMSKELLESLRGARLSGDTANTREIVFLELSDSQFRNGMYVDPWGSPYELYLSTSLQQRSMAFQFRNSVSFPMRDRF